MIKIESFFELLQVSLGRRDALSSILSDEEWKKMLVCAQKQALVGVCFTGVEALPKEQRPGRELLMQWYALTTQIEARNGEINTRSVEACRYFEKHGFMACVLKGQGNARMYAVSEKRKEKSEKLAVRRQSGDIDVWVKPHPRPLSKGRGEYIPIDAPYSIKESRLEVLRWVRQRFPNEDFDLKHIHFPIIRDVAMEVHFVPSLLRSPIANRRLQRFYEQEAERQMQHQVTLEGVDAKLGGLNCPTPEFNLVFQLTHIFDHFISEGVGLRQVMDYYFVLRTQREQSEKGKEKSEKYGYDESPVRIIKSLGLYGFAGALMWVLHEVLGMEEELMLCPMDERRGRVLLDEILAGGNFGQYESRYWYSGMSRWKFYVARMRRMMHFLRYYPSEVLWDIPFRIKQRVWMIAHKKK